MRPEHDDEECAAHTAPPTSETISLTTDDEGDRYPYAQFLSSVYADAASLYSDAALEAPETPKTPELRKLRNDDAQRSSPKAKAPWTPLTPPRVREGPGIRVYPTPRSCLSVSCTVTLYSLAGPRIHPRAPATGQSNSDASGNANTSLVRCAPATNRAGCKTPATVHACYRSWHANPRLQARAAVRVTCGKPDHLMPVHDKHLCADCLNEIRHEPKCAICGRVDNLVNLHHRHVCTDCAHQASHA